MKEILSKVDPDLFLMQVKEIVDDNILKLKYEYQDYFRHNIVDSKLQIRDLGVISKDLIASLGNIEQKQKLHLDHKVDLSEYCTRNQIEDIIQARLEERSLALTTQFEQKAKEIAQEVAGIVEG